MRGSLLWGSPEWFAVAASVVLLGLLTLAVCYWRAPRGLAVRLFAPGLKTLALVATAVILLEPLLHGSRPRPGANLFLILVDDSASLQVCDDGAAVSRGTQMQRHLGAESPWLARLGQDFDVRRYAFDSRLHALGNFAELTFRGEHSQLGGALRTMAQRFVDRPVAGVLLLTDGNSTDTIPPASQTKLPPVYSVLLGSERTQRDIRIARVAATQANFQAAPVTIQASVEADQVEGDETLVVELLSEAGKQVERQTAKLGQDRSVDVTFRTRPEQRGLVFYQVRAYAESDAPDEHGVWPESNEATYVNNLRQVAVHQQQGPYRVLYVGGRPNWEFKFLRRALEPDNEVQLTGLLRIAKREPKFDFRGRSGESSNPLFRGFENQDPEDVERYDQPVLLRLNVEDAEQLRDGFPKAAEELFVYDALILDDVEAAFFSADQMTLVQRFVSQRGGGLMMLGGQESFAAGGYYRTPIGDLLPVYVSPSTSELPEDPPSEAGWRLQLTRWGQLQPWVRVRSTEQEELQRLASMPHLKTLNAVSGLKPGANVLITASRGIEPPRPALVAQNFGRGRVSAVLLGDFWRWAMHRPDDAYRKDFEHAWQQSVRWLVADVPRRVACDVKRKADEPGRPLEVQIRVRDSLFLPQDNAQVRLKVHVPGNEQLELLAEASAREGGLYTATYVPRLPGMYRAEVNVIDPDGKQLAPQSTGWVEEPDAEEFARLRPNRTAIEQLSRESGGEMIELDGLESFVRSLPDRKVPVVEPWIYPLWHRWPALLLVLGCLVGEWSLRRWRGLP